MESRFQLFADGLPEEGMWKCHPAMADVNGDGLPDLAAIARKGDGPHVWLGDGKGTWRDSSQGLQGKRSCGGGVALDDVNGDGLIDLVVADHCFGIDVFLGNGAGQWTRLDTDIDMFRPEVDRTADDPFAPGVEDVALGDFDSDGAIDLVVGASGRGGVRAFRNAGDGGRWIDMSHGLPSEGFANTVLLEDVNRDGLLDIVAAHEEGPRVWLGNGGNFWLSASEGLSAATVGGLYYQVALGDVNEDGRIDLVAANWVDGVELYLQSAVGEWEKQRDVFREMQGGAIGIGLADLDGDGHMDIAVTGREALVVGTVYGIFVLRGDGTGVFERVLGSDIPDTGLSTTWCVTFGDVNLDGVQDLVAATGGVVANSKADASRITKRLQVWSHATGDVPALIVKRE
ncbi:MAG: VCBS repeat-containing protein [Phycisphaerales bacterium]|nr:VCBS repeat-containing protein [Phycisphaerales bacterium]MCB9863226.1 VCBS repeat-containing protein [Phycisphaerales bacterium]